jgi:hypothetical protein
MQIPPSQCRYHAHVLAEYRLTIGVALRMKGVLVPERHPIFSSSDWVNNAAFFYPAPG